MKIALCLALLAPLTVDPLVAAPTALSAGGYHFVRVEAGAVVGLGDGTYGQLGANPAGIPATVGGLGGAVRAAAGVFSTITLRADGTVWFLGDYSIQHTTPHGTPQAVSVPEPVSGLSGIDAIAAGHRHFLALDADTGNLLAWGHNGSGQVGDNTQLDRATAVQVLTGVATMAAGNGFSVAVKTNGEVWTWGRNAYGQLGLGDTQDRLVPTKVPGITTGASAAAGGNHLLIRLANGTVRASGDNQFGQLGNGGTTSSSSPIAVPGLSGITAVSAGWNHSAALGAAARVWGRNFEGQCGGGNASPTQYSSPTTITLTFPIAEIVCGGNFTLFRLANNAIWGAGSNTDGQLDGVSLADPSSSQKVLTPKLVIESSDSDNDQLLDTWEDTNLLTRAQTGEDDFDADGTNNLGEFRLGLDPANGSSRFEISLSGSSFTWTGVQGVAFAIQRSTQLTSDSWITLTTVPAVAGVNSFTDPSPPDGSAFYRVLLVP